MRDYMDACARVFFFFKDYLTFATRSFKLKY